MKRGRGQLEIALSELEGCVPSKIDIEHVIDQMVLVNTIEAYLRQLPRTERNIFIGRYWYLYKVRDLAKAYQMSESAIMSVLYRTRKKLRLHLEKEGIFL